MSKPLPIPRVFEVILFINFREPLYLMASEKLFTLFVERILYVIRIANWLDDDFLYILTYVCTVAGINLKPYGFSNFICFENALYWETLTYVRSLQILAHNILPN